MENLYKKRITNRIHYDYIWIGWKDFEHLIRELFEKEYNQSGAENAGGGPLDLGMFLLKMVAQKSFC
ncbi:hypothetical protein [Bacillus sp. FSL K6-3431]|uniref:hypothetical protein n=1 Tax=Bacillus sp. FSL K6-3431 TaxID=2921500 RepID=UPI0030F77FC8